MFRFVKLSKTFTCRVTVSRNYTNPPTLTATQAIEQHVRSGSRVLVGSGAAEPQHLVEVLSIIIDGCEAYILLQIYRSTRTT